MPASHRSRRLAFGLISIMALGFDPTGVLDSLATVECWAQYGPGQYGPAGGFELDFSGGELDAQMAEEARKYRRGARAKSARKKMRRPPVNTAKKDALKAKVTPTEKNSSELKFSMDVAPILVGFCVDCHTGEGDGLRGGKLDLSSFDNLMAGTPKRKVIVPGKPEESHLYLRVTGKETPSMPQGDDRALSEAAIAKIERWIKAGASLDPGLDARAAFASYAASPREQRKVELGKLSGQERDKKTEEVGRSRWAKANPKLNPEITSGEHFLLFANLPGERAARAIKLLEAQHGNLKRLLGAEATDWPEKVGVYVFNDPKDLIEFIRTVEGRDIGIGVQATSRMSIALPYLAILDPARGQEEASSGPRRRNPRSKQGDESASAGVAERTLAGLLSETLAAGVVDAAGKPPGWLSAGLGVYFASRVEPRSAYLQGLRTIAADVSRAGWDAKANEVLADSPEMKPEEMRAIGYVLVEWLMSPELRRSFPDFVQGMLDGPSGLPGLLKSIYNSSPEEFATNSGEWVAERFGDQP